MDNTFVNQIGDVGVPQHVRSHLEVHRIHQLGIVRLMLTKPWLYSMLDGLPIYIGVITAFCGGTDCYVLPDPHKLASGKTVPFELEITYSDSDFSLASLDRLPGIWESEHLVLLPVSSIAC